MKILTAAQMREVDRRTMEMGIPGLVLMENAGHRVMELLERRFAPLQDQRAVIFCGKGNNGGDGFVVARQLYTRARPKSLDVLFAGEPEELRGESASNYRAWLACGGRIAARITPEMRQATLVIDALLGTGIEGAARGRMLEWIREINTGFPHARIVAVDIPSGLSSDSAVSQGETVRAGYTVTFTAPKIGHMLPPNCDQVGELVVGAIGSPPGLYESDPDIWLAHTEPHLIAPLFAPRTPGSHKGSFGHVLVVGGSRGKTGAAAMTGLAAARAGAGLVTVASSASAIPVIAGHAMELMTEELPETPRGSIAEAGLESGRLDEILLGKTVLAVGPGLGSEEETVRLVRRLIETCDLPMVLDADALNALAGHDFPGRPGLILTPHPGEMGRLCRVSSSEVLQHRLELARSFAMDKGVCLVLKGQRTLIAFPNGMVWVNPTGTPGLASGGTGDVLTGLAAGLLAQFPERAQEALLAAVWLHGRCGELAACKWGEKAMLATDLLPHLPGAMEELSGGQIPI